MNNIINIKNEKKGEEIVNLPILKVRKKKNKYFFNEIQPWFDYYKDEINNLYRMMLKICKNNKISMNSNQDLFSEFVMTLYHNSEKKKLII